MAVNEKSRAIHYFIFRRILDGAGPTIREIGQEFGVRSTNGVRHHLDALEAAGYIERSDRLSRSIRILIVPAEATPAERARFLGGASSVPSDDADLDFHGAMRVADRPSGRGIPILGRIAAGGPIAAAENFDGELALEDLFGGRDLFALRVQGQSMRDRGILHGDLVVVHKQAHARDGDAVVALLGEDATVKTYRRTATGHDLVPENPDFEVRHVTPDDDFRVLGVVVGLVRPPGGPRRT